LFVNRHSSNINSFHAYDYIICWVVMSSTYYILCNIAGSVSKWAASTRTKASLRASGTLPSETIQKATRSVCPPSPAGLLRRYWQPCCRLLAMTRPPHRGTNRFPA
ncbi:MAG: hypothetical protein LBT00_16190, partial [Spirochaetaceae bacterium]|nr:hypothetical protein [Spirochaetaceae bacterium]